MKSTDIPTVIYSVPELKAVFYRLVSERKSEMPSQQQRDAGISVPFQSAMSLGVLTDYCHAEFIGLTDVPGELINPPYKDSRPFYEIYKCNDFRLMTAEEADQFPFAIRKLG